MKFGLEAEKFIFDHPRRSPSKKIFSLLNALSDFDITIKDFTGQNRTTNEFVLNMVEFGTAPSTDPLSVLQEYLFNYLLIKDIAARDMVSLVPLGALPMDYLPQMIPKRAYFIQNSILAGEMQHDWIMDRSSPLRAAGNSAGIHVHTEIETPKEFLFANNELCNKFNLGLMLTPMIAFASSPYFFLQHEGMSMRGLRYYQEVYKNFPLNGGLPPVMESSADVLRYTMRGQDHWIKEGIGRGFSREEMVSVVLSKGANWSPIRWNNRWNTIELRCLDSDYIQLDAAKFMWITSAMKRMDQKGENLKGSIMRTSAKLERKMIEEALEVSGQEVLLLPSGALNDIFERAMRRGLKDDLVTAYLNRVGDFIKPVMPQSGGWISDRLFQILKTGETTSERILSQTKRVQRLNDEESRELVQEVIAHHENEIENLRSRAPGVFKVIEKPQFLSDMS